MQPCCSHGALSYLMQAMPFLAFFVLGAKQALSHLVRPLSQKSK
jgi:hypothetical protein